MSRQINTWVSQRNSWAPRNWFANERWLKWLVVPPILLLAFGPALASFWLPIGLVGIWPCGFLAWWFSGIYKRRLLFLYDRWVDDLTREGQQAVQDFMKVAFLENLIRFLEHSGLKSGWLNLLPWRWLHKYNLKWHYVSLLGLRNGYNFLVNQHAVLAIEAKLREEARNLLSDDQIKSLPWKDVLAAAERSLSREPGAYRRLVDDLAEARALLNTCMQGYQETREQLIEYMNRYLEYRVHAPRYAGKTAPDPSTMRTDLNNQMNNIQAMSAMIYRRRYWWLNGLRWWTILLICSPGLLVFGLIPGVFNYLIPWVELVL